MNIGVNLLLISRIGIAGGVEQYIRNTLAALRKYDPVNKYFVFVQPSMRESFQFGGERIQTIVVDEQSFINRGFRWIEYHLGPRLKPTMPLDEAVDEYQIDVMYFPCTILFPSTTKTVRKVLTIVDIQQEYHPEFFDRAEMRQRRRHYRRSALTADRIVAISAHTASTLREKYGVPADKISTIGIGAGDSFFASPSPEELNRVKRTYHLPERFLYYPAASWPHKNHIRLLEALAEHRTRYGEVPSLVLTGIIKKSHSRIEEAIRSLMLGNDVRYLGYISETDIVPIYWLATALVYPSLFEGFGIPIVEAMATGTPIICSRSTSLPDIAGDAALLFDPRDVTDISDKIHSVWTSVDVREKLSFAGRMRSARFTASSIAEGYVRLFEKTIASSN